MSSGSARKRCLLVGMQAARWPTLAIASLKAAADADERLAGRVEVKALHLWGSSAAQVAEAVCREAPDVVGFSCYLWSTAAILAALPSIRRALPKTLIVLGGPDVHPQAEKVMEEWPEVDLTALGEGESTLPRLLEAWLDGRPWSGVPGLAYRDADAVARTPEPTPVRDLDSLPSPYLSGALPFFDEESFLTLETSRGCPFDCKYCDWPGRRRKPREFSLDRVLAEIELIARRSRSVNTVFVADADIFVNKPRAKELLRRARPLLAGTRILLNFEAYLGRLDDELLRLLDSPNFLIGAGIQTITPEALKVNDRFFHREAIERVMRRAHELSPRLRVMLHLISGLPGDTLAGVKDGADWCLSLKPSDAKVFTALLLPGSELGRSPGRFKIVYEESPPRRILSTPGFGAADRRAAGKIEDALIVPQLVPFVRQTLSHLAELAGRGRRPFLRLYEEFAGQAQGLLRGEATMHAAAGRLLRSPDELERLFELLRGFARARLASAGRGELLPAFEHYWRVEAQFLSWLRRARAAAPELLDPLQADLAGARRTVWLGLEELSGEQPLASGVSAAAAHHQSSAPNPYPCPFPVSHFAETAALASFLPDGADAAVLSHLYTRLPPAERAGLLALLGARLAPRARLVLWDGLLGRSPLDVMTPKPRGWRHVPAPFAPADLERELAGAGWSLDGEPLRVGESFRFRFAR